jgi:acetate kinase
VDAIVFTGGIGENSSRIRSGVCRELDWFGIELDPASNAAGPVERKVSTAGSRVQVWTVPTNEEIVVARQAKHLLEQK